MKVLGISEVCDENCSTRCCWRRPDGWLHRTSSSPTGMTWRPCRRSNQDTEERPAASVLGLRRAITDADVVLLVTPEYNGSVPGQLKNALDWASRPVHDTVLRDKPVAVIGASPSPGGTAGSQADARKILKRIGAQVLDVEVQVAHAHKQFDKAGKLTAPDLGEALCEVMTILAESGEAAEALEGSAK